MLDLPTPNLLMVPPPINFILPSQLTLLNIQILANVCAVSNKNAGYLYLTRDIQTKNHI